MLIRVRTEGDAAQASRIARNLAERLELGSTAAVRLAWEKLIAPELQHLAWEVVR